MNILKINSIFILCILLFFLIIYFKLFESSYIILKYDYEKRLIKNYGYVEKFIWICKVYRKNLNSKNIKIIIESHPLLIFLFINKRI